MENDLELILNELIEIQTYLRKLGPSKRLKYIDKVKSKISTAKDLYKNYKSVINVFSRGKSTLYLAEYVYTVLEERIESVYSKILSYNVDSNTEISILNMEKFDIKTATSLIPQMDNTEETTEKIIDGIDMYSEYLNDVNEKKLLISFVLKTRLTKSAKLKLKCSYDDIPSLIQDIKAYLLTKKSPNSMLCQLNNLCQNDMTISEYGNKLSELFVGLTIAQADGNSKASEILRPINEKLAIKRFSDGLRNRRLSTIIAARNYSELKDAVRATEDEELAQPSTSTSNSIFSARGKSNQRFNNNYRGRGRGNATYKHFQYRGNQRQNYYNSNDTPSYNYRGGFSRSRGRHNSNFYRGRGARGRGNQRNLFAAQVPNSEQTNSRGNDSNDSEIRDTNLSTQNQFFRT